MVDKTRARVVAAAVVAVAVSAVTAAAFAAPHRRTIAYLTYSDMRTGWRAAAKDLGVHVITGKCVKSCPPEGVAAMYRSMIARHVDAIVTDGYDPQLAPTLNKARKAGILVISSGDDIAAKRDLWVSQTAGASYAAALADALAVQMGKQGEYAILEQRDEYPIADAWGKLVQSYVAKTYPGMKLDGVVRGTGAGDPAEVASVKRYLAAHPKLKGLVGITPTETYTAGEAITEAGRIGQVFVAGNGGDSLSDPQQVGYVRSGAEQLVFGADPAKLGYLTVWAANYLLTGHRFRTGSYQVGGPVGMVWYYPAHRELRLGQPLTITKANVDLYAGTF